MAGDLQPVVVPAVIVAVYAVGIIVLKMRWRRIHGAELGAAADGGRDPGSS